MNPIITTVSIATGAQGTLETLRIMRGLAVHAAEWDLFKDFALMFRSASEVDATLRPHYEYTDEPVETLFAPEYNLAHYMKFGKIIGDCDDIAMFYAAIFNVLGIRCRLVAMRTRRNDPNYFHVVVEAYEYDRWKRFDATVVPGLMQIDYGRMEVYV